MGSSEYLEFFLIGSLHLFCSQNGFKIGDINFWEKAETCPMFCILVKFFSGAELNLCFTYPSMLYGQDLPSWGNFCKSIVSKTIMGKF